jgi:hypothetical protein
VNGHLATDELRNRIASIRGALEPAFASDTAVDQMSGPVPSAGHCAAVAVLVSELLGGTLVSATVNGQSHWFNRVPTGSGVVDVDVTGDQFGLEPIRIGTAGSLYEDTRARTREEVHEETFARAAKLGARAGLEGPRYST